MEVTLILSERQLPQGWGDNLPTGTRAVQASIDSSDEEEFDRRMTGLTAAVRNSTKILP